MTRSDKMMALASLDRIGEEIKRAGLDEKEAAEVMEAVAVLRRFMAAVREGRETG